MKADKYAPVSQRALVQRIGRALAKDDKFLKANRSAKWQQDLGNYYIFDSDNHIRDTHVNLEALGRELGVLRGYEYLKEGV